MYSSVLFFLSFSIYIEDDISDKRAKEKVIMLYGTRARFSIAFHHAISWALL